MNYANIKECDIANGVGVRTSLFVSGCTHHCPGCFNEVAWDFNAGDSFTDEVADRIIASLAPSYVTGLTVLGGEPMEPDNQRVLAPFLARVRRVRPAKDIWLYTGDVLEELMDPSNPRHTEDTERIMELVDVLVDGPFVVDLKDITLRFRGSSNQRIIDMVATRREARPVLWSDDPIFAQHTMGPRDYDRHREGDR